MPPFRGDLLKITLISRVSLTLPNPRLMNSCTSCSMHARLHSAFGFLSSPLTHSNSPSTWLL